MTKQALCRLAFVAVAAAAIAGSSQASPVTFKYTGPGCTDMTNPCATLGATVGEVPAFTLTIDSSALTTAAQVTSADVLDFSINIGTLSITKASAAGFYFGGFLNNSLTAFDRTSFDFTFIAAKSINPTLGDSFIAADDYRWAAGPGWCDDAACSGAFVFPYAESPLFMPSNLVRVSADEPSSLALLGLPLVVLALARRRKPAVA